ncbi:MAG TPA: response regulator [Clostridia bacterium]|nr:response regulator [Clostridia bacterium]
MLKAVLVDDEPSVLEGLLIFVDWRNIGFEIAGVASDGTAALAVIREKRPDLVISDIRMPGLTGLELIEKVNSELDPTPKFMLLSGYSDFAYARKALQLGALGYLSKPLDAEELASELSRAAQVIRDERNTLQENTELIRYTANQLYNDVMQGLNNEKLALKVRSIFGLPAKVRIQIFQIITDTGAEANNSPDDRIYEMLENITGIRNKNCIFFNGAGSYIVIIDESMPGFNKNTDPREIIGEKLRDISPERYGYQAVWTLISDVSEGGVLEGILCCGKQLEQLKAYCLLNPQDSVLDYRSLMESRLLQQESDAGMDTVLLELPFDRVINALKGNDPSEVISVVNEFFEILNRNVLSHRLFSICLYRFADIVGKVSYAYGIEAGRAILNFTEAIGSLNPNCKKLALDMCCSIFERINSNNVKPLVTLENEIIEFIRANYMKSLSLQKIAEKFSLPAIIISKIIKKKTGQKFNDYFNYLRIEHAKTLFAVSDMKTAAVCEESGYADYGYFVEKFKEYAGVSPSEYKKKFS